jgi:Cdc6-like AAA superfamily ATPase
MIEHPEYFRESFIPRTLPHRQAELERLASTLDPAVRGETPNDILLSGPSGVGKTVVATKAVRKLHEKAGVRTAHIRCLGRSAGAIIQEAVDEHPRSPPKSIGQTTPVAEKAAALDRLADSYLLVLDEADDVHKTELFGHLAGIDGVSYIAICHNPNEWMPSLSEAASRRLYTHIEFSTYGVSALTEILTQRAQRGLVDGAVEQRTLEAIAERVGGVARTAIQALFQAAQLAEGELREQITREDVPPALERAREAVRRSNLRSLPVGHLLVYHIIQQAGEIDAPEFHSRYDAVADAALQGIPDETPVSQQTRRRYLDKLSEYDLVKWVGERKGRRYIAMDPSLEVPGESGLSLPQPASQ